MSAEEMAAYIERMREVYRGPPYQQNQDVLEHCERLTEIANWIREQGKRN